MKSYCSYKEGFCSLKVKFDYECNRLYPTVKNLIQLAELNNFSAGDMQVKDSVAGIVV